MTRPRTFAAPRHDRDELNRAEEVLAVARERLEQTRLRADHRLAGASEIAIAEWEHSEALKRVDRIRSRAELNGGDAA